MTVLKGFDFSNPDSLKKAEENGEEQHFLRYVKHGEEITVGLLKPSEYALVQVYDIYPITGTVRVPDEDFLFPSAKAEMFRLADILKKECGAEEFKKKATPEQYKTFKETTGAEWIAKLKEAYRFDTQERFLFGFYDFETGAPFVMQTTKKQAEGIYKKIAAAWELDEDGSCEAMEYAFTVSKGTGGFALDVDTKKKVFKLPLNLQENHRQWREQEITEEQFSTAHNVLSVEAQKEVIKKFAAKHPDFDLKSVIGEDTPPSNTNTLPQFHVPETDGVPVEDIKDEELPF